MYISYRLWLVRGNRYSGLGIEGGIFGREIVRVWGCVCLCEREREQKKQPKTESKTDTNCLTHSQTDTQRNKQHPLSPLKITALRRTWGSQYIIQNKNSVRLLSFDFFPINTTSMLFKNINVLLHYPPPPHPTSFFPGVLALLVVKHMPSRPVARSRPYT